MSVRYGTLTALADFDFVAADRSVTAVIGPNGSGKTTFLNALTGAVPYQTGRVSILGDYIEKATPGVMHRAGLSRTFQNLDLMAGVLAASLQPFTGSVFLQYFLIALTATLVGGLRSLWLTAVGGLAIGVILSVTQVWSSTIGLGTLFVFLGVVALVLLRKHWPSELSKIGWSRCGSEDP